MKSLRFNHVRNVAQRGFTLVELVVVLALITVLASVIYPWITADNSKAQLLLTKMTETGKSLLLMKTDTSCFPTKLKALYDKESADSSFCGIDLRPTWKRIYTSRGDYDSATGNLKIDDLVPGGQLSITNTPSTAGTAWLIHGTGIPNQMIRDFLSACNGTKTSVGKCTGTEGGAGNGTVDFVFYETT